MSSGRRGRGTPSPHQLTPQSPELDSIEPPRMLGPKSPRPRPKLAEPEPQTRPRRSSLKTGNASLPNHPVDRPRDQGGSRLMTFDSPRIPHTPPMPTFLYNNPAARDHHASIRTRGTPPPSSPRASRRRKSSPAPPSPMPKTSVQSNQDPQPTQRSFPPPLPQQNLYQPPRPSPELEDSASEYEQEDMSIESSTFASRSLRASSPMATQSTGLAEPRSGGHLIGQAPSWPPPSPEHRSTPRVPTLAQDRGFDEVVNNDVPADPPYELSSSSTATTTTSTRPQVPMRSRGVFHVVNQDPIDDKDNSGSSRSATSVRKSYRGTPPMFSEPSRGVSPQNERRHPGTASPNPNLLTPTMPELGRLGEIVTPNAISRTRGYPDEPSPRERHIGGTPQELTPAERLARKTTARWQKSTPNRDSLKTQFPNALARIGRVSQGSRTNSPNIESSPFLSNERGISRVPQRTGSSDNSASGPSQVPQGLSSSIAREPVFNRVSNDRLRSRPGGSSFSLESRSTALSGLVDVLGLGMETEARTTEDFVEATTPMLEQNQDFSEPVSDYEETESIATSREFGPQYTDVSGDSLRPATTSSSIRTHNYERHSDLESLDYVTSNHDETQPLSFHTDNSESATTISSFTREHDYRFAQSQHLRQPNPSMSKSRKPGFNQAVSHNDALFHALQPHLDDPDAFAEGQPSRMDGKVSYASGVLGNAVRQEHPRMTPSGRIYAAEPRLSTTLHYPTSTSSDGTFSIAGTETRSLSRSALQAETYQDVDRPQRRSVNYADDSEEWSDGAKHLFGRVVERPETGADGLQEPEISLSWAQDTSIPSNASPSQHIFEERSLAGSQRPSFTVPMTWKSTLPNDAYRSLLDKYGSVEMHRQEVIWDICRTEQIFVKTLRTILRIFVQPLRTKQRKWIPGIPKDIMNLFDWLDDILQLHTHISSSLLDIRSAQYPVVLQVAEALRAFVPCLEVHQPYLVRLDATAQIIEDMTTDPQSDFGEFIRIQAASADAESGHLPSLLQRPVQRLSEYNTYFRQLWELTPRNHPDYLATFSLLHSTELVTKVMHEVRVREDEYELVKTIARRIIGLPDGFILANRGRRLIAQGLLRRVTPSERELSAFISSSSPKISLSALTSPLSPPDNLGSIKSSPFNFSHFVAPITSFSDPGRRQPSFEGARPESFMSECSTGDGATSDSRSTTSSTAAMSPSSTDCSLRSMSNASSYTSLDHDHALLPLRRRSSSKALRSKRDVHLYAFVFTDFVLLTNPVPQRPDGQTPQGGDTTEGWKVLDEIGLSRVLGVSDVSGSFDAEHLLCVDLLPMSPGTDSDISDPPSATPLYLSLPDRLTSRMALAPAHILDDARLKWLDAFERCSQHTLRSLCCPLKRIQRATEYAQIGAQLVGGDSVVSMLASGQTLAQSPSQQIQGLGDADEEQERVERSWWSDQYHNIMLEMERSTTKLTLGDGHLGTSVQPRRQRAVDSARRASNCPAPRPLMLSSRAAQSPNLDNRKGSLKPAVRKGR